MQLCVNLQPQQVLNKDQDTVLQNRRNLEKTVKSDLGPTSAQSQKDDFQEKIMLKIRIFILLQ